jgi:AraC-like DNA-binding protein
VRYREFRPAPELSSVVSCTWERAVPRADAPAANRVLPDGSVDLIWRGDDLVLAGPDRGPFMSPLPPGETVVGLRLRRGLAGHVLGVPASELRDARLSLEDVWNRPGAELAERIGAAETPDRRRQALEGAVQARLERLPEPDVLVLAAVRRLGMPGSRVGTLSAALGMSERQLLRRFNAAIGYGPKMLDRVLRFQRFLSLAPALAAGDEALARAAADLGYADQAHLTRDCAQLSGVTPARLVASRAG